MKARVRGFGGSQGEEAADPFEDLAEMFESELSGSLSRIGPSTETIRRAADGAGSQDLDEDFAAEFADALAVDMARSMAAAPPHPVNKAYQSWIAPRAIRLADPSDDGVPSYAGAAYGDGTKTALALQTDLGRAFRGLSAPARPRGSIVVETQSFAPERVIDSWAEETTSPELDEFDELIASELAVMNDHGDRRHHQGSEALRVAHAGRDDAGDGIAGIEAGDPSGAYDDEDDAALGSAAQARGGLFGRSARLLGGGVAALALVGAVGFYLLSDIKGAGQLVASAEPPLIRADAEPFKMAPKEPGGRSIPNQNKAVYERVASPGPAPAPVQQALLTNAEEPMNIPAEDVEPQGYDNLPGVDLIDNEGLGFKEEGRIEEIAAAIPDAAPAPILQPRKVRTLIVRPDGTLMSAEMPVAAPAIEAAASQVAAETPVPASSDAAPVVGGAPGLIEIASADLRRNATEPVTFASGMIADDVLGRTASSPAAKASVAMETSLPETTPDTGAAPVVATMPDVQSMIPIQVAGPVQVAAIAPVAEAAPPPAESAAPAAAEPAAAPPAEAVAALPAGGYFVQISSQPSEALAKQSMRSLGTRYSNLIEGRAVGIQSAEIPGKGTFYRVRVAAASKSEASSLCNRLKSAGGNCFVAR